jgi:hypothetical protein
MRWLLALTFVGCGFAPSSFDVSVDASGLHDAHDAGPPDAFATVGYVQSGGSFTTSASAFQLAFSAPHIKGGLAIVVVLWDDPAASLLDVTGAQPFTAIGEPLSAPPYVQQVWFAPNVNAGADTVTATLDRAVNILELRLVEYSGVAPSGAVDVVAGGSGQNGTQMDSGTLTTQHAHDLLFMADTVGGSSSATLGSGFMERVTSSGDACADRTVSAVGSYHADAMQPSPGKWIVQLVAFEAAD